MSNTTEGVVSCRFTKRRSPQSGRPAKNASSSSSPPSIPIVSLMKAPKSLLGLNGHSPDRLRVPQPTEKEQGLLCLPISARMALNPKRIHRVALTKEVDKQNMDFLKRLRDVKPSVYTVAQQLQDEVEHHLLLHRIGRAVDQPRHHDHEPINGCCPLWDSSLPSTRLTSSPQHRPKEGDGVLNPQQNSVRRWQDSLRPENNEGTPNRKEIPQRCCCGPERDNAQPPPPPESGNTSNSGGAAPSASANTMSNDPHRNDTMDTLPLITMIAGSHSPRTTHQQPQHHHHHAVIGYCRPTKNPPSFLQLISPLSKQHTTSGE